MNIVRSSTNFSPHKSTSSFQNCFSIQWSHMEPPKTHCDVYVSATNNRQELRIEEKTIVLFRSKQNKLRKKYFPVRKCEAPVAQWISVLDF